MNAQTEFQFDMSREDRELLLRGLRYVRSAAMLDCRMPSAEEDARRRAKVGQIVDLQERLEAFAAVAAAEVEA